MFGLTRNPTSSNNYTNIAYGWYFDNSGTLNIVESGSSVFTYTLGSFSTSDFYQVTHDGKHVCYYRNGVLVRSVVDATDTFYLQACFYNSAAAFYGIEFTNTAAVVTPFTLEALSTNVAVNGTRVQANTAVTTDAWGLRNFQSVQSYANGCALSASATGAGGALYIGLSTAPAVTTTPLSVLAGWYVHGDSSQCNLIYNGATIGAAQSAWVSGDVFEVTYDMFNFRWFRNGVLLTQQAATGVAPLYVFGDFYDPALCFEEISFQPIGAATPTQWTAYGTATATDSYITQHGGPADYSSGALSINSFSTCNVLFKANQTTAALIVGFTTFSTSTLSSVLSVYTANYGIYLNEVGQVYTVENGTFGSFVGDYTTSDLFSMSYDGSTVTYYQNGISFATSSVSGASFRAVVNLAGTGATCGINSVDFGPGASVPVVDTAQIGPNAATTTYFIENDSTENVTYAGSILYGSPAIQLPYVPAPQLSFTAPGNAGSTVNAIVTVMTSVYLTNTSGTTTPNATVIAAIQDTSSGTQLDYFPKIAAAPYYNAGGSTTSSQTAPQQIAVHDNVTLTAGHSYNVYLACQTDASSVTAHFTGTQIQVEVIKK